MQMHNRSRAICRTWDKNG